MAAELLRAVSCRIRYGESRLRIGFPISWPRVFLSPLIVAAIGTVCHYVFGVNATTAGFAFLLGILLIAASWGLLEALLASTVATVCFSFFFLPPIGHLAIADPGNWVALSAFLATSLVASRLSDRARKQTEQAKRHQAETERLYDFSRSILFAGSSQDIGFRVTQQLARIFECRAVVLYDPESGQCFYGGVMLLPGIEDRLKRVAGQTPGIADESDSDVVIGRISRGDCCLGSLALSGIAISDSALQALLKLVAIAFEGVRAQGAATRAEAARQSEEFKSTLLDAITHELKTPLASIKIASSTILHEIADLPPQIRELTSVIDEESDRLNALVTDAVRMAQMDASSIQLEKRPVVMSEFVRRVLAGFTPRLDGRALSLRLDDQLPPIVADPDLASMALRQVIDNSLKYSPPGTPLDVAVEAASGDVIIRVRDQGPGIPQGERERIFERFYRRKMNTAGPAGSGLGLYIAREIVRTHGGNLWVEPAGDSGSEFCMLLPARKGL